MHFKPAEVTATVDAVIRSRKTVRAFRAERVPRSLLIEILELARTAPSTFNTQPWRVHVLVGRAKQTLSEAIVQAHTANAQPPHSALPNSAPPDCVARQADFGQRYYTTLGVDRMDMAARSRQTGRNFVFFDAPVGLIFTIDATLTKHSWLDYGLFMQNLILAAQARGLATCPQVSFVRYQSVIAEQLELAPEESVVCGMSLGYADEHAPLNRMGMPRDPLETFTYWRGFDE
jgi:nitroreductase